MADFSVTTEDHAESYWKTARVLRVVGWTCIVWGCMISIYIWTGLKAGSTVWLVWTMGQFFAGAVCLALSAWFHHLGAIAFLKVEPRAEERRAA